MPLETEIVNRNGHARKIAWSWEDRCIITKFVILDGGRVGEVDDIAKDVMLNWGYAGAGCDHTFTHTFGYSQADTKKTIWLRSGQGYREWRGR